jgi:hypothetical protein
VGQAPREERVSCPMSRRPHRLLGHLRGEEVMLLVGVTDVHRVGATAASFGGGQCINIADVYSLRPAAFTFAAWASSPVAQYTTIFGRPYLGATTDGNLFELYTDYSPADVLYVVVNHTGPSVLASLDTWYHVAGVFDGSTLTVFIDGVAPGVNHTVGAARWDASDSFSIGCDRDTGIEKFHFNGFIDDVRFYDHPLAPADIAALSAM